MHGSGPNNRQYGIEQFVGSAWLGAGNGRARRATTDARGENAFFRFKTMFGDRMRARGADAQAVEVRLACNMLNQMTELGRPESYAIES